MHLSTSFYGRNVSIDDKAEVCEAPSSSRSSDGLWAVTDSLLPFYPEAGYYFEIEVTRIQGENDSLVDSSGEHCVEGLAIGVTGYDVKLNESGIDPSELDSADQIPTSYLVGFHGLSWNGGEDIWQYNDWAANHLREGDVVGCLVTPLTEHRGGILVVFVNGLCASIGPLELPVEHGQVFGVVDLLGDRVQGITIRRKCPGICALSRRILNLFPEASPLTPPSLDFETHRHFVPIRFSELNLLYHREAETMLALDMLDRAGEDIDVDTVSEGVFEVGSKKVNVPSEFIPQVVEDRLFEEGTYPFKILEWKNQSDATTFHTTYRIVAELGDLDPATAKDLLYCNAEGEENRDWNPLFKSIKQIYGSVFGTCEVVHMELQWQSLLQLALDSPLEAVMFRLQDHHMDADGIGERFSWLMRPCIMPDDPQMPSSQVEQDKSLVIGVSIRPDGFKGSRVFVFIQSLAKTIFSRRMFRQVVSGAAENLLDALGERVRALQEKKAGRFPLTTQTKTMLGAGGLANLDLGIGNELATPRLRRRGMSAAAEVPPSLTLYRAMMPKPPPTLKKKAEMIKRSETVSEVQGKVVGDVGASVGKGVKAGIAGRISKMPDKSLPLVKTKSADSELNHDNDEGIPRENPSQGKVSKVQDAEKNLSTVGQTSETSESQAPGQVGGTVNDAQRSDEAGSSQWHASDSDDRSDVSILETAGSGKSPPKPIAGDDSPSLWWLYLAVVCALLAFGAVGCWTVSLSIDVDDLRVGKGDLEDPPTGPTPLPRKREPPPNTWENDDSDSETDGDGGPPPPGFSQIADEREESRIAKAKAVNLFMPPRSVSPESSVHTDVVSSEESVYSQNISSREGCCKSNNGRRFSTPGTRASSAAQELIAAKVSKSYNTVPVGLYSEPCPLSLSKSARSKEVQQVLRAAHEFRFSVQFLSSLIQATERQAVLQPFSRSNHVLPKGYNLLPLSEMVLCPPPSWKPRVLHSSTLLERVEPSRIRSRFFTQF